MGNRLPAFLAAYQSRVDHRLDAELNRLTAPTALMEAIRYSLFNGGKRIRPALVFSAARALGGDLDAADPAACAVELIHAYSLVHDDLPSMDDDELRRGKPTTHIAFGEATAILAGDAMQALAFQLISQPDPAHEVRVAAMVNLLARAVGAEGMVAGQMIDLESTGHAIESDLLDQMHLQKTAALISASVRLGALSCSASDAEQGALQEYGDCLGLAFQIQDDILDIEGTAQETGKTQGADAAREKPTYVSLHGMNYAKRSLGELAGRAHTAIEPFGTEARDLHELADFVIDRSF